MQTVLADKTPFSANVKIIVKQNRTILYKATESKNHKTMEPGKSHKATGTTTLEISELTTIEDILRSDDGGAIETTCSVTLVDQTTTNSAYSLLIPVVIELFAAFLAVKFPE